MYYVGIDLGGTNIAVGVVDENGNIIKKASSPTLRERGGDAIISDMVRLVFELTSDIGISTSDVEFLGVACPGVTDSKRGVFEYGCNLPLLHYPLADKLRELTGIKSVGIENDANAAAKGEAEVGCAKGYSSSVMITLGTGVGGGIILDGKIVTGFNFVGAEIGHMVIEKDGRQCTCGRRGCFETYSSATGLILTTKEKMLADKTSTMWDIVCGDIDRVNGRTAFDAMRMGDKAGTLAVDEYIDYLATGVCNIVNILAPEVISIGGGISNEGDTLLIPLKEKVSSGSYANLSGVKDTEIKIAKLRNDAGIIGAAMLGVNV